MEMNTADFKHFKLHNDSTLKSMTKDELIGYIHMLYHNGVYQIKHTIM